MVKWQLPKETPLRRALLLTWGRLCREQSWWLENEETRGHWCQPSTKSKPCVFKKPTGNRIWMNLLSLEESMHCLCRPEIVTKLEMHWKVSCKMGLIQSSLKQLTEAHLDFNHSGWSHWANFLKMSLFPGDFWILWKLFKIFEKWRSCCLSETGHLAEI